ncbi:MAG TPA: ABC transporter permease [Thermoanaerobaculia bacterium]|jgi:ABC-2 type transport system permease protein
MLSLIQNETLKLIRRKRLYIVMAILAAIIGIVSYGQYRHLKNQPHRNWRADIQQRLAYYNNNLRRSPSDAPWARSMRAEIKRLQFYLDHDIDPNEPTSPMFVRGFANVAGFLLLPLLVAVLGSDIVSAEHAEGTDKLLLTRPVRRWKILTSKLVTLWIFTTITLLAGAVLAYLISSPFLPRGGWGAPTFTGFGTGGTGFNPGNVRQLPLWKDALIAYGLEWYAMLTVATIALLLSVVFRSSAGAIGTMLASLIAGTILTRLTPDWTSAKYLFVSALPLADYYTGEPPPYDGMSMIFCITLLGAWAIAAIIAAYAIFTNRDVFG